MIQDRFHPLNMDSDRGVAPSWLRFRTFDVALRPGWRGFLFFLLLSGGIAFLGREALDTAYVSVLGNSAEVGSIRHALALDPANPELYHRLGMLVRTL